MFLIADAVDKVVSLFDVQLGVWEQRHQPSFGQVLGNENASTKCHNLSTDGGLDLHAAVAEARPAIGGIRQCHHGEPALPCCGHANLMDALAPRQISGRRYAKHLFLVLRSADILLAQ